METICPLLTLGGDARAVSATSDPGHRCAASGTLSAIDREHQLRFCLGGAFESCERYRTHVELIGPVGPTWGPAAPDATFSSTRMVLESAPRTVISGRSRRARTAAAGVVLLLISGVALAWVGLDGLGSLLGPPDASSSPSASTSPAATAVPSDRGTPGASPTDVPSPAPTLAPTPAPAPTPVTYIVQAGDTLNAIAARFGTTAPAIMQANRLTSEIIQVGQVLIIPAP